MICSLRASKINQGGSHRRADVRCHGQQGPSQKIAAVSASICLLLHSASVPVAAGSFGYDASGSPYQLSNTIAMGPTADGSLRPCPSGLNPNCVSTSSNNDTYVPAWRSKERSVARTVDAIDSTVLRLHPEAELVQSRSYDDGMQFRAYELNGLWGKDVVEFLVKADGVQDRNWEGDSEGPLVLYRSIAGSVKYVYPFTQPITDFGLQRKRAVEMRKELDWPLIGCELLECYES